MHPDWQNQTHQYCEKHSSLEPEFLQKLTEYTWRKTINPRQLSGHLQGRFLSQIVHVMKPKNIVELGTFTGYATYCLTENASSDTQITTIEADAEIAFKTQELWKNHPWFEKINWLVGEAINLLPSLEQIDLLFVDADKQNYKTYFDMALPKLTKHGVMIFDNTLWSGKLVEGSNDKDAQIMQTFNEYITQHPEVNVSLLPIRDGLTWVTKKI